jgi:hypothetical protein
MHHNDGDHNETGESMKHHKQAGKRRRWSVALAPILATSTLLAVTQLPASADPWVNGDVVVAVSNGQYRSYTSTGTLEHTIQAGGMDFLHNGTTAGFTTGCGFNPAGFPVATQNLYTTLWSENKIRIVNDTTHTLGALVDTTVSGTANGHPESIVFNTAGDYFVGLTTGDNGLSTGPNLLKFSKTNVLVGTWTLPVGARGVDAIDLAPNGDDIYYTSEDNVIRKWTIATTGLPGTGSGSTFATLPAENSVARRLYGLRLLQGGNPFGGGNGTGFLMVADTTNIKVLNSAGSVINTYGTGVLPRPDFGNGWFSVSIDAGGSQFVAGDFYSGQVVKFNATGGVVTNFQADPDAFRVNGVCVRGELTVGVVPFPTTGFFVVGDLSAGLPFNNPPAANSVTFSDQGWKAANSTSGPQINSNAFKGFAENTIPATADCGGIFRSKGGNAGAGAVTVGQKVAVIVTKSTTDPGISGVVAQGNIDAIVLVTVTSYSGGGVPVGKGTVIQVLCTTP